MREEGRRRRCVARCVLREGATEVELVVEGKGKGLREKVPRCILDTLVAHTKDDLSCRRGDVIGRP
jgi:hypothetical protein